ncbi:MAG: ATP synthase F1 subunit gamma [Planctomycetota bacterium]
MGKSREIKKRMKAVGNIRRITRTMQMIATAKFSAAQQRAVASQPYTEALFHLVAQLAEGAGDGASHPLLQASNSDAPHLALVMTSNRGLCGPFNGAILRKALAYVRSEEMNDGLVELVGKKGLGVFRFNGIPVSEFHDLGDEPTYEQVQPLAQSYIDRYAAGEISGVSIVYTKYISAGKQQATIAPLIPFSAPEEERDAEEASGPKAEFEFSPSAAELLDTLLPAAVKAVLFQAFNDSVVSEHVARMVAMKSATDNAAKMGKNLQREYNRARQAQITTELTEIISGAAALG